MHITTVQLTVCRVGSTTASYSEGPRFKSRPGGRLSWLRYLVLTLSSQPHKEIVSSISHGRFLPNSLFTIHPIIRKYILPSIEKVIRFEPGTTRVSGRNAKHPTSTIISHTKYFTDFSTYRCTRPHCPSLKHLGHLVDIQYEQNGRFL